MTRTLSKAERKAKSYYRSCLDTNHRAETLGMRPLRDLIRNQFRGWSLSWNVNALDFQDKLEKIHALGVPSFFSFFVGEDAKEPTKHILQVNVTSPSEVSAVENIHNDELCISFTIEMI